MSARIVEIELLREENAELRAALSVRDRALAERDDTIAAKDEQILALAKALHFTQEELEYLRRRLFGRRSEKMPPGPTLFEDVAEPALPPDPAPDPAPDDEGSLLSEREVKQARRKPSGRKPLPASLPRVRIEHHLCAEERICPDCRQRRRRIGETTSEVLEYIPAQWIVHVHARGRYACPLHPDNGVAESKAPLRPIPGSYAGAALLAHLLVFKYDDHLPLYRQAEIFRRTGVDLARSTLCVEFPRLCGAPHSRGNSTPDGERAEGGDAAEGGGGVSGSRRIGSRAPGGSPVVRRPSAGAAYSSVDRGRS